MTTMNRLLYSEPQAREALGGLGRSKFYELDAWAESKVIPR